MKVSEIDEDRHRIPVNIPRQAELTDTRHSVPDPDFCIHTRGNKPRAIGREPHTSEATMVPCER